MTSQPANIMNMSLLTTFHRKGRGTQDAFVLSLDKWHQRLRNVLVACLDPVPDTYRIMTTPDQLLRRREASQQLYIAWRRVKCAYGR